MTHTVLVADDDRAIRESRAALAGAGVLTRWGGWLATPSADVLADTLLDALGRHGGRGRPGPVLPRLGLSDERRDALTVEVDAHLPRVVIAAELVDLGAVPAFLAAGFAGVGLRRLLAGRHRVPRGGDRFSEDLTTRPC